MALVDVSATTAGAAMGRKPRHGARTDRASRPRHSPWQALLRGSLLIAAVSCVGAAHAQQRAAVVIGNAAYGAAPLVTAVQDARSVGGILREMNFNVLLVENATAADLKALPKAIADHTRGAELAFVYYAGHSIAAQRDNLLLPVDAKDGAEAEVRAAGLSLQALATAVASPTAIIAVDAGFAPPVAVRGAGVLPGFVAVERPRDGTLLAFSAAPGSVAPRPQGGINGPYATALLNALSNPNVPVLDVFRDVRRSVREVSRGGQLPTLQGGLAAPIVLRAPPADAEPQVPAPLLDQVLWTFVRESADEQDFDVFARAFPTSRFTERARARQLRLASATEAGVGTLRRQITSASATVVLTGLEPELAIATTGDRAPPQPLRAWPRELPPSRTGLATMTRICDDLAADPDDPMRISPGVNWNAVNRRAAVRACILDLVREPDNRRLMFQLGRVLDISGYHAWAEYYYREAMARNYSAGVINLAYMYLTGRGRPADQAEAVRLMRIGADMGNLRARTDLGFSYLRGQGVEQSTPEALLWLRLAGANGWPNAIDVLGNMYQNGQGVPKNDALALELFATSAWIGNTNAMVNLGRAYIDGRGVAKDLGVGRNWLERSSDAGNPFAPFFLAQLHINGTGVPKSVPRGQELLNLAANRGFGQARFELGQLYERGAGVPPNLVEAAFNYGLADKITYETPVSPDIIAQARARLDDVRRRLTPAQREAVDRRIEEWVRLNGP